MLVQDRKSSGRWRFRLVSTDFNFFLRSAPSFFFTRFLLPSALAIARLYLLLEEYYAEGHHEVLARDPDSIGMKVYCLPPLISFLSHSMMFCLFLPFQLHLLAWKIPLLLVETSVDLLYLLYHCLLRSRAREKYELHQASSESCTDCLRWWWL